METLMSAHKNPTPLTRQQRRAYEALSAPRPSTRVQLAEQAFALAFDGLGDDWPRARTHLDIARKYVLFQLGAGRPCRASDVDLWFAAELIARTLEADVGMTWIEIAALFDSIGLPIETVPTFKTYGPRLPMADAISQLTRDCAGGFVFAPLRDDEPDDGDADELAAA
jgi:hypothetical protein